MSVPVLYEANATDFFNKGLGTLPDALTAVVTEERNGEFIFEMTYPVNGARADLLENNRIIKVDAGHVLTDQRFVIKKVTPQMSDDGKTYIDVYAEHISYVTNDLALKPSVAVNGSADNAIKEWQRSIVDGNSIVADSDITTNGQTTWTIDKVQNARQALGGVDGSILDVWGGEYLFDNLHISLKKQRGSVSNSLLAYGRNITSFQQEENIQNTYTSIYPYATLSSASDDTSQLYTLNGYFVDSQYVNNYPNRKILPVDFSSNFEDVKVGAKPADASTDDKTTYLSVSDVQAQLKSFAQKYITDNAVGIPTVSITVSFVDLSKTSNYADVAPLEQLDLCDTVPVRFSKLGINTTAKVTHVEWNVLTDSYNVIELGSITPTLGQTLSTLTTVAQAAKQAAQDAQNNAITAWKSADGKTTTFDGSSSQGFPIAQHIGDLYFRENGDNTELYIWSGAEWKFIVSNKTGQNISDAVDQAMSDADTAKQNANNAVETGNQALAKAQTGIDTANAAADKASDASVDASKAINDSASAIAQAQQAANDASTAIDQAQQIANGLTTLQNTVSDNNSAISKAQKDINTAQSNISQAQTDLATAKKNITTNANAIKDANGNISLLQTSASKFQNSITDVQGDISILQQDSTSFKSEIGSLQADNGTNKQNISTLQNTVNGFNSTVAQVQQQVNDSAVGANLLAGTSGDLATKTDATGWGNLPNLSTGRTDLTNGTYTASGYIAPAKHDACIYVQLKFSDGTYKNIVGTTIKAGSSGYSVLTTVVPSNAYLSNVWFSFASSQTDSTSVSYKDMKLEKGSHATSWCLAPSEQATVTQISTLSNTVDGLSSTVSKKANQSDLNGTNTQLSNLSNTVNGLSSTVASKANNSDLQSTETKVSNLQNTVDGLNTTVSTVQTTANQARTDVTTLKQQANGFQTSISSLQQTKADQSWTTNQITASSNSLKITIADIQGQVNDSAVGANLLIGTKEFSGTWTNVGSWNMSDGWKDPNGNVAAGKSSSWDGLYQPYSVTKGQTYTFSAYYFLDSWSSGYTARFYSIPNSGTQVDGVANVSISTTGKWVYFTHTFTAIADGTFAGRFELGQNNGTIHVGSYKFEKGSHATSWCLAPSEQATVTQISTLSNTVDGLSSTVSKKVDNDTFTSYQTQTATAIANKVSSSTFNSYQTQTDKAIQQRVTSDTYNAEITTLNNMINSKVSQQDWANSAVGANLLIGTKEFSGTWTNVGSWNMSDGWKDPNGNVAAGKSSSWDGLYQPYSVTKGQTYTFSAYYFLDSWSSGYTARFYSIPNSGTQVDSVANVSISTTGRWVYFTHTFTAIADGTFAGRFELGQNNGTIHVGSYKFEKGSYATPWCPAASEIANYSQIQQLSDNINLRVQKNDVINQINVSSESILIAGNKVHITGQTTIDNAVIKSAMIDSLSADKITAGTLNAANVNIINMNANNISTGTLTADRISGGTLTGVSFHQSSNNNQTWIDNNGIHNYDNSNESVWIKNGLISVAGGIGNNIYLGGYNASMILADNNTKQGNLVIDSNYGIALWSDYDLTTLGGKGTRYGGIDFDKNYGMSITSEYAINFLCTENGSTKASLGLMDGSLIVNAAITTFYGSTGVTGDLSVTGSKNAIVETSAGWARINAYETAEYYFGDIGETQTGSGCEVKIMMDSLFLETVNTSVGYQVFITPYSNAKIWVDERNLDNFVVKSDTPNAKFSYEIKAKRKGYENVRLEIDKDFRKEAA